MAMYSPCADGFYPAGFPHSEISGSKPVSGSPELIAAVHVLRRLWLPRHPPYALRSLTLFPKARFEIARGIRLARVSSVAPSFMLLPLDVSIQFSMNGGGTNPPKNLVELIGIEPTTSGLQSQRSPN